MASEQLVEDLNRTIRPSRSASSLPVLEPRGGQAAQRGRGTYQDPSSGNTGVGIASPLTEKTVTVNGVTSPDREYWPNGLKSSDGLFTIPSIKTLNLIDANGAAVQIQLADAGLVT